MKRVVVFYAVGPLLVLISACLAVPAPFKWSPEIVFLVGMFAFFCSLPVTAFVGTVDACLAPSVSLLLRTPLTALAGAIAVGGPASLLIDHVPPSHLKFLTFAGAAYAGICALLANDWTGNGWEREDQGS
jgi:hypothetical protein